MLLDYFKRFEALDFLIRAKSTGNPSLLSKRLGISERQLYGYLVTMRAMGAPIKYSRRNQSYYYAEQGGFVLKFRRESAPEPKPAKASLETTKKTISKLIAHDIPVYSDLILMLGEG